MHRALGIGLLAFFSFVLAGIFPAQWLVRHTARREMRAMIRARSARLEGVLELTFRTVGGRIQDASFQWEEEHREFFHDGKLYDVISSEPGEGQVTFRCIQDGREERMLRDARDLTPGIDPERSPDGKGRLLVKFMCEHFLGPTERPGRADTGQDPSHLHAVGAAVLSGHPRDRFRPPAPLGV